ncbi:protein TAPT1 homolog [Teleopsis dalmanni]|uniref:protein TAPT1 homolog n=1 Tax=Teleopsis dalmanni TaxID=139649 RepID=UPI0018CE9651|nr:protein TAPT1 homolog [Teleopsis dalmanni]XP_037952616.1 protein TAPT1 homolog [Teleopsis dalmanni]
MFQIGNFFYGIIIFIENQWRYLIINSRESYVIAYQRRITNAATVHLETRYAFSFIFLVRSSIKTNYCQQHQEDFCFIIIIMNPLLRKHKTDAVKRKIHFQADKSLETHVEDLTDDEHKKNRTHIHKLTGATTQNESQDKNKDENKNEATPSFKDFFKVEMTRSYMLEHDEERFTARRQKIYSFIRIPRDLERFIVYGIMQCADSFLYIHTFLPIRFAMALWSLIFRPIAKCFGLRHRTQCILTTAEICDLLKCTLFLLCTLLMISIDTNRVYHIIKSQSIIKLYIFYNMLEVGDRLLSAFGQDTIDSLFWTATEPKHSNHEHFGVITHIIFALIYVVLHSFLIMFQATTLNVAVNSNNKGLLTIMISNNFVELKGSVFKKFDKNNLFQLTCSDVRERFHLCVLLFIVVIQTMKEFEWSFNQFCVMIPDCVAVFFTEVLVDWLKHAFITRFNELPEHIYREYTTSLAYDMTQTRQKHAFSDHSDLVARRMGFIPFPLGVVLVKAIYTAVTFDNVASIVIFLFSFVFIMGLRICLTICALGKACKLMKEHQDEKNSQPSSFMNVPHITTHSAQSNPTVNSSFTNVTQTANNTTSRIDAATSPKHPLYGLKRSNTSDDTHERLFSSGFHSTPNYKTSNYVKNQYDVELSTQSLETGATAIFSNSDVDLEDVCLNENVLDPNTNACNVSFPNDELARSEPDLFLDSNSSSLENINNLLEYKKSRLGRRTHKRSESEPAIAAATAGTN